MLSDLGEIIWWFLCIVLAIVLQNTCSRRTTYRGGHLIQLDPARLTEVMNGPSHGGHWELEFRLKNADIPFILQTLNPHHVTLTKTKAEIVNCSNAKKWVRETKENALTFIEKEKMYAVSAPHRCTLSVERTIDPFDKPCDLTRWKYRASWLTESKDWRWDLTFVDTQEDSDLFTLDFWKDAETLLQRYSCELELEFVGNLINMPEKWRDGLREIGTIIN